MSKPKYIVVIGTSAGGVRALEELVSQFTPDMDAAFFIVLHLSRKGVGGNFLFNRLQGHTKLKCKVAVDQDKIERGNIYLAPPDHHLLVSEETIIIGKGAPENGWRPSINNLFRSAAFSFTTRVIGIILTGLLDDGSAGMSNIKRCGGKLIVQDPNETDYPDMPLAVLENMEVDFCVSLSQMGEKLNELLAHEPSAPMHLPEDIAAEAAIDVRVSTRIDDLSKFEKSEISCPDCGGGLHITQDKYPTHYRCHVGHSFTDRELFIRVSEVLESTFWTSLRMMEERRSLLLRFYNNDVGRGFNRLAERHLDRAKEIEVHISNLKEILFHSTDAD